MAENMKYFVRSGGKSVPLQDCVAVLLRRNDGKIGLCNYNSFGFWFPVKQREFSDTWLSVAEKILWHYFPNGGRLGNIISVTSFSCSEEFSVITRVIFVADVTEDHENVPELLWVSCIEMQKMRNELLDSLPIEFYRVVFKSFDENPAEGLSGFCDNELALPNYGELKVDNILPNLLRECHHFQKANLEVLINSAQLGLKEQKLLFQDFICHCYPSVTMNWFLFFEYMKLFNLKDDYYIGCLFRAFDHGGKGHLTFKDFLIGLAAFDPSTQHGGPSGEIRCRFIFRLYDSNSDSLMEYNEFQQMIEDIHNLKGAALTSENVDDAVRSSAQIFGLSEGDSLSLSNFLNTVGQLKFRGTSCLFRATKSIFSTIAKKCSSGQFSETFAKKRRLSMDPNLGTYCAADNNLEKPAGDFDLATHSVKVKRSGSLDVLALWDLEGTCAVSRSAKLPSRVDRVLSIDCFNPTFNANEMLHGLRYFALKKSFPDSALKLNKKEAFSWGSVNRISLGQCILKVCRMVKEIMAKENRVLQISSPAYILGDIHGNFQDLVSFEKTFWRLGFILTPASFVFLGDYVDRGEFGVEVISYLFSQKILAPSKIFLLRGNHEIRSVQEMFTFQMECSRKFGDQMGREIWSTINECFDVMPIAALVDNKIFCVHGGIPPPWILKGKISNINSIPNPLPNPEEMSELAWELMWSDPISHENLSENKIVTEQGFCENTKRGTAHSFTAEALEQFLINNNLSHVVRAHEVQQAGFRLQLNGKLLTVFSSSKYCGGSNEAACILADRSQIRTIRLDTS